MAQMHPVYLDCAATTPVDPRVRDLALRYLDEEFGNAGSRTHDLGLRARSAVEKARGQVAAAAFSSRGEVIFTSGATESNNLALLGLAAAGRAEGRTHIVSTAIEHNAVLEPLALLGRRGFELMLVPPTTGGWVEPQALRQAMRPGTLLVSMMLVNNETGIIQPVEEVAELLGDHPAYFHVDAAQGFGQAAAYGLRHPRIDLISISGHKIHAPKGIGALVARRRNGLRPPIEPLMVGGGQELGLRPGTHAVHLIAALGLAAELALAESAQRARRCARFRQRLLEAIQPLGPRFAGEQSRCAANIINFSLPGLDSQAAIEAISSFAAVSAGAACTSQSLFCSHVLSAMGLDEAQAEGALRLSWSYLTPDPDWPAIAASLRTAVAGATP
jgi:cysteine desulfurase